MRESDLRSALSVIEPSAALKEKTKLYVKTASVEEQSVRLNFRWFFPKAVAAVFALIAVFTVIGIVNRAPAIYGTEFKFANKADFEYTDLATVPSVMSIEPRAMTDPQTISASFAESEYWSVPRICVTGVVTDASLYLYQGGNELYGICIYTINAYDIIKADNLPDFMTEATELKVAAYLTDESEVLGLVAKGTETVMWLYTAENGGAVNEYGKLAGLEGAWELYECIPKPENETEKEEN